jgi:hypothetical protein
MNKYHIQFIVEDKNGVVTFEKYIFETAEKPWDVIRKRQQEILAGGAKGANTSQFRTLLDIDGYRD